MRSARALFCLLLTSISFCFLPTSKAQQDYLLELGTPPGSPSMPIPMGVVNPQNGNVHLEFPLRTYVQRNGLKVTAKLTYDSRNCYQNPTATTSTWLCWSGWQEVYSPFQGGLNPYPPFIPTNQTTAQCPAGGPNGGFWYNRIIWTNFTFTDATGTSHLMNVTMDSTWFVCQNLQNPVSASGYAYDGTGYYMTVTLSSQNGPPVITGVWDKSGNTVLAGEDTNGNFFSSTDELGRSYLPGSMPSGGAGSQQFAGSTIQWQNIPVYTAFGGNEFNGTISVINSITLPDGRSYQFTYDQGTTQGHYGQITGITLPTGGQLGFSYVNVCPGSAALGADRRLTTLSEPGATWTFTYNLTPACYIGPSTATTTVTAPPDSGGVQNQSVYTFSPVASGPNGTTPWSAKYYSGAASGTPLRETDIVLDNCCNRVAQQTTILDNGMSSKVLWAYQNSNNTAGSSNVTSKQEYDFSGNLARETTATYQTSTAYTGLNITDRPLSVKVYGAGGAASGLLLAQTNFAYDSTALSTSSGSAGNSVLGATGHDDANYGTGKTIRGNLTSVSQMVSSGNFITTKTNYYNTLGEVIQTTDARGNSTLLDYTDKWASGTSSCVPGSTYAYPTTITLPGAVTNKNATTYNACDGTVYSTQDQNDLNASRAGSVYTYDGLQRVTNVSFPDGGSEQTNYGGTAIPQIITKTKALTSSSSVTSYSTLDGLGRAAQTALTSDPDGTSYTATTFDNLGRAYQVYNPTRCNPPTTNCNEPTWGITTYFYDALGRTTKVIPPDGSTSSDNVSTAYSGNCTTVTDQAGKSRESCTDALGRLTQVFEDPGSSPHVNYETDYAYDALNNLLTVNQKGGSTDSTQWRARAFTYDSLSRLLTASNPESGSTTYAYDANGNLTSKIAPAPNQTGAATVTTAYQDDALNRLTAKTYSDQTLPVVYFYDGQTPPASTPSPGTATVIISGLEQFVYACNTSCDPRCRLRSCTTQVFDHGTMATTVNGLTKTVSYGQGSTTTSLATAIASAFNSDSNSPVSASAASNVVTLTAKSPGSASNYPLSAATTWYDSTDFTHASFTPSGFGFNLTGGCNTTGAITMTNGIGRRTGMCDAAGAEAWTYDPMGRVSADQRNTNNVTKVTSYTYNLDGSLATLTYPSGRVITYTPGAAGRPLSAVDSTGPINYALNATYSPQGALASVQSSGSLYSTYLYNNRLQPCWLYATTSSAGAPTSCTQTGVVNAAILDYQYNFSLGVADNGNVNTITNRRDPSRSQSFSYDNLNRIATAQTTSTFATSPGHCWGETYQYDGVTSGAWGNLTQIVATTNSAYTGCSQESGFTKTADGKNHLSGFSYDAAGNTTNDGVNSYVWDAKNQLTSAGGVNYLYDGDGKRVQKSNGKLYWYGSGSDPLDETDLSGNLSNEYVFFGGTRIARRDPSNNVDYYFADYLGSARVVTSAGGTILDDSDFYPFGVERPYASASGNAYKFEKKERDTETGNDDFGARYYSNRFGRWLSADWSAVPVPVPYANLSNPQTLNLYAMVADDPESFADLDGHCCSVDDILDAVDFVSGFINAAASNNGVAPRKDAAGDQTFASGQVAGDVATTLQGVGEVILGGGGELGGLALDATGVGAAVGVPANVASATVIAHGSLVTINSGKNLVQDAVNAPAESRSSGPKADEAAGVTSGGQATDKHGNKLGPSGDKQVNRTSSNTREAARNKALKEGSGAEEHRTPSQGNPHFHPTTKKGKKQSSSTHHEYPD